MMVTRDGANYHIYLHYLPDNSYYARVVTFIDKDTIRNQYLARTVDGRIEEWVINGIDTRTGSSVELLSRCDRVLLCSVTDGSSTNMEDVAGTIQPYFSKGDIWPLSLDLAAGTASVPYRKIRGGISVSVNEQYTITTSDIFYTLRSNSSAFGLMNNGLFQVDTISIEINRQNGSFAKILKILDRNANRDTYQYFTENGQCRRSEQAIITPVQHRF